MRFLYKSMYKKSYIYIIRFINNKLYLAIRNADYFDNHLVLRLTL